MQWEEGSGGFKHGSDIPGPGSLAKCREAHRETV